MRPYLFLLLVFFMAPHISEAAVGINEVAWMGTAVSANDEWIELYNSGSSAVTMDGWKLIDGMNLEILLSGSIPAGAYAVLERTDDATVPPPAFVIYTGALPNTGATLKLLRGDGSLEDQIAGGENWSSIGGDNVTKETAQYTAQGWITAPATPGTQNSTETSEEDDTEEDDDTATSSTQGSVTKSEGKNELIELKVPNTELTLAIVGPTQVYVNQPVSYEAVSGGVGETILNSLLYTWSFGDLESAEGKKVNRSFTYPGEYVVTVEAYFARHTQVARRSVTVLPTVFQLSQNAKGDLLLHNNAKYEVDISSYTLKGVLSRTFPKNTIMLAGATITIPKRVLGLFVHNQAVLLDQKGEVVARLGEIQKSEQLPIAYTVAEPQAFLSETHDTMAQSEAQEPINNFSFASDVVSEEGYDGQAGLVAPQPSIPAAFSKESSRMNSAFTPYAFLLGLIVLSIVAVLYSGTQRKI